jgi:hypothetical protein
MSTVPALSAGLTTVISVDETTVTEVPALDPKATELVAEKLVPAIVTVVLPEVDPETGFTDVTVGRLEYVNWSAELVKEDPKKFVTVMSTVPVPAGLTAVISVVESTTKLAAGVDPKSTALALLKSVPVTATVVPPAGTPSVGLTELTTGDGT